MKINTGSTAITHEEAIVIIRYHPDVETLLVSDIDETMIAACQLAEKMDFDRRLLMVIPAPFTLLSDGAGRQTLKYLADWERVAIVSHALPQRILGTFLARFSKATVRLFKTEEGAHYWLKEG